MTVISRSPRTAKAPVASGPRSGRHRLTVGLALFLLIAALWASVERSPVSLPFEGHDSRLATRLAALVATPVLHRKETGIDIRALPDGRPVFSRNARRLLRPASTLKILTAAAALALLKPEYVYQTGIYSDHPIDADGTLRGNLYIRGSGAPDLVGESWWRMTRELSRLGLRRVEGDLIADEGLFDSLSRPHGWPSPSTDSWYNAPVGALSANFNVVTVRVDPASEAGGPPGLSLDPIGSYFRTRNRARTALRPTSLSVDRVIEDGRNTLVLKGTIRLGGDPVVFHRAVEEAALYALHTFRETALAAGITVAGAMRRGTIPEGAGLLHEHPSKPLAVLVRDMNKHSNNFMAEALLKTLGARFRGLPGTTAGGIDVVRAYLLELGIDTTRASIEDGSGLSGRNRIPASLMTEILVRLHGDFETGPELIGSLSTGGADGTLEHRFEAESDRRRVRAKTGQLAGVSALAGYVVNRDARRFAFTILANHTRGPIDVVHRAIDRIVRAIANSSDADLEPAPTASTSR